MATKSMDLGQVMGTSAYQAAQAGGYTGTQTEFNSALKEVPEHIDNNDIHVTAEQKTAWNGKASKPTVTPVTLTAAGWDATTKKQTVTVPGVLADTSKQVIWVTQTTESAIDAYLEAGIVPVAQAANAVTLRADTVPTADITVNIVVQEVGA